MATQAEMDRLLGKALFDPDFRYLLLSDPVAAAESLDYELTQAQLAHIQRLDAKEMQSLAKQFEEAADWHPGLNFLIW